MAEGYRRWVSERGGSLGHGGLDFWAGLIDWGGWRMEGTFTETLGQYLTREREARSVSLEELSRGTRISRPYLEALEQDNFHFFSKREYIVGFLKGYARHLGLDPEELLKRFHIQFELTSRKESFQQLPLFSTSAASAQEIPEPEKIPKSFTPSQESKRSHRRIFIQGAIVIAAVGLTLYLQQLLRQTESSKKFPRVESTRSQEAEMRATGEKGAVLNSEVPGKIRGLPQEKQDRGGRNPKGMISETIVSAGKERRSGKVERDHSGQPISKVGQQNAKVIGNRNLKSYSLPGMKDYGKVKPAYRIEFNSEEEAVRAGYRKAPQ
jgi:transcriptional regulator with XRE-family HTH domain